MNEPLDAASHIQVSTPTLKLLAGVRQRQEPVRVQALRAQSAIERLDERIVGRLAGSREVEHDVVRKPPARAALAIAMA